jgi:hypothetical protein
VDFIEIRLMANLQGEKISNRPGGGGKRVKALSLQETGQRADSVHLVERLCSFYHPNIQRHSPALSQQLLGRL